MAFRSTTSRSDIALAKDIEAAGLVANVAAGRENIFYSANGLASSLEAGMTALAETVVSPKLSHWEVKETLQTAASYELNQYSKDAGLLLIEAIHQAAYGNDTPLGRTFYVNPKKLTDEDLRAYTANLYTAGNMTIVGAGVSHDALVAAAEKAFGSTTGSSTTPAAAKFVGGASLTRTDCSGTHVALTFDAGSSRAEAAVFGELVSRQLGGISARPFNINFSDSNLFGVHGASSDSCQLTEQIVQALKAASSSSDASIDAAKLAVKTQQAFAVEHPIGAVGALVSGTPSVDGVDAASVKSFASALLKSTPAFSAVGNTLFTPSHASVSAML